MEPICFKIVIIPSIQLSPSTFPTQQPSLNRYNNSIINVTIIVATSDKISNMSVTDCKGFFEEAILALVNLTSSNLHIHLLEIRVNGDFIIIVCNFIYVTGSTKGYS